MAYFESEPAGATGINNSAPIVLATDHNWPIPTFFAPLGSNCVSGCTAMLPGATSGVTVLAGPPAGYNLYVTSIQVSYAESNPSVNYFTFKAGSNAGTVLFYTMANVSGILMPTAVMCFSTPIKVGATGLFVIGSTGGIVSTRKPSPVAAQGIYLPI